MAKPDLCFDRPLYGGRQSIEKTLEVLEGRSPLTAKPKPVACTAVSEPLHSKGFLSPFAARRAKGEVGKRCKVVKKVAEGEFFDELKASREKREALFCAKGDVSW